MSDELCGLNVDGQGIAHLPTLKLSGANAVRMVLLRWDGSHAVDLGAAVGRYVSEGVAVLGVFARESLKDWDGVEQSWDEALAEYADMVADALWGIQLGNEYSNTGTASWHLTPLAQSDLIRQGAEAFRAVNPHIAIVSGAIGTGQPSDLGALDFGPCTHVGINLYNASVAGWPPDAFGPADRALPAFAVVAGARPLILSEWSTTNDAQAERYIPMSAAYYRSLPFVAGDFYFRYQDGGDGEHMGLFDASGQPTVRWKAYLTANAVTIPDSEVPPMATIEELAAKIQGLEDRESLMFDLFARTLKGDWDKGAESAEALLRAISPKYKDFEAVPFP